MVIGIETEMDELFMGDEAKNRGKDIIPNGRPHRAGGLLSMMGWFGIDVSLFGRLAGHWIEQKMAMGTVWAMGITIGCQVQLLVNLRWDEATGIEKDE